MKTTTTFNELLSASNGLLTTDVTTKGVSLKLEGKRLFNYDDLGNGNFRLKLRSALYLSALDKLCPGLKRSECKNTKALYSVWTVQQVPEKAMMELVSAIMEGNLTGDRITHVGKPAAEPAAKKAEPKAKAAKSAQKAAPAKKAAQTKKAATTKR